MRNKTKGIWILGLEPPKVNIVPVVTHCDWVLLEKLNSNVMTTSHSGGVCDSAGNYVLMGVHVSQWDLRNNPWMGVTLWKLNVQWNQGKFWEVIMWRLSVNILSLIPAEGYTRESLCRLVGDGLKRFKLRSWSYCTQISVLLGHGNDRGRMERVWVIQYLLTTVMSSLG